MNIGTRNKEFFLLMFFYYVHQVYDGLLTKKYFTFPVNNKFLKIISCGFGDAEIFHSFRYVYPHFNAHPEKMVCCITTCENNGRMLGDVNLILPEIFC